MAVSYWRERDRYYRILGSKCQNCNAESFPPLYRCRKCGSDKLSDHEMPQEGKILAYTLLRDPMTGFEDHDPMPIALIELNNGVRIVAQLADTPPDQISVGSKVRAVFRRVRVNGPNGQIFYGYKFAIKNEKVNLTR